MSWLADPVLDLDRHRRHRAIGKAVVAVNGVAALCILWYAATRHPLLAVFLLGPAAIALGVAWKHRAWLLQNWSQRCLPHAAMEERLYALLDQHQDAWLANGVHSGGAPCVSQWRWKREGLWLEQCSVFTPDPAHANARRRLPVGRGEALVAHRAGPFGLANLLFAQAHTSHRGLVVLEWTTAHSRLSLIHAVGLRAKGTHAPHGPTHPGCTGHAGAPKDRVEGTKP
jgi:hypothetical protein